MDVSVVTLNASQVDPHRVGPYKYPNPSGHSVSVSAERSEKPGRMEVSMTKLAKRNKK